MVRLLDVVARDQKIAQVLAQYTVTEERTTEVRAYFPFRGPTVDPGVQ
jgi:hypothetical protein